MKWQRLISWIQNENLGKVTEHEMMSFYTSWRIGGPARAMFWSNSIESCMRVLEKCIEINVSVAYLGNGTNLLVADEGIDALVINTGGLNKITWQEPCVKVEAGTSLATLAVQAGRRGLKGLEFAIGIPGTVGGATLMNAGAYGGAMSDLVESILVIDQNTKQRLVNKDELGYDYRHSLIKDKGWLIWEVNFKFFNGDKNEIEKKMNEYLRSRKEKQPLEFPNGGSVFKNPTGQGAGRFIDGAGLKGLRVGDAQISLKHANFIVNLGQATANDVSALIHIVKEKVSQKYGVKLETEIIYWG